MYNLVTDGAFTVCMKKLSLMPFLEVDPSRIRHPSIDERMVRMQLNGCLRFKIQT